MYCKFCNNHYPPFRLASFRQGEAIEAYQCPQGHIIGKCKRYVLIQQKGQTKAGKDAPCRTCSDKAFCLATFQKSDATAYLEKEARSTPQSAPSQLSSLPQTQLTCDNHYRTGSLPFSRATLTHFNRAGFEFPLPCLLGRAVTVHLPHSIQYVKPHAAPPDCKFGWYSVAFQYSFLVYSLFC